MNTLAYACNQKIWDQLTNLKKTVHKKRQLAIKERLQKQPQTSDLEYLLGAFIQMYEPHLEKIVYKLAEKGYAMDPASGFSGNNNEIQSMIGEFSIDYVTKNRFEKLNIKFREHNGLRSLVFWPDSAKLDDILDQWMNIVNILPDKKPLTMLSMNSRAIKFRRKYIPQHSNLQKQRLFEKLKFKTLKKIEIDMKKRKLKNPHPDKFETMLGFFIEEIEPQVRQVVINLNKKGYAIDVCGFMENSCDQMIEGDFKLDGDTIEKLGKENVLVETNPSGYTRVQFSPEKADLAQIKKKWNKIASLIPDKHETASSSMTRHARDFRQTYL
jgi:hypothetical protein